MCEKNYAGVSVFFTDCKGLIVGDVLSGQFDLLGSSIDDFTRRIRRIQGVRDSSEILKNYKELKVWQSSYQLY